MDGGADGVLKQNFERFTQTLDRLPGKLLDAFYLELRAA
jgi:hypothetical protein